MSWHHEAGVPHVIIEPADLCGSLEPLHTAQDLLLSQPEQSFLCPLQTLQSVYTLLLQTPLEEEDNEKKKKKEEENQLSSQLGKCSPFWK